MKTYFLRNERFLPLFIKKNAVFFIAFFLMLVTCVFVPIDAQYLEYFDLKTLTCLFCMLLVICALRNICFFRIMARKIIKIFKNTRSAITALVFVTYFSSMLIANDMALITFLPLGIIVLKSTGKEKYMIFTFIMQNVAANLGGMLTPFGNPQNLYLYNYFHIPNAEFFSIMLVPFIISLLLIILCCAFIKKEPLEMRVAEYGKKLDMKRTIIYVILFIYSIIIVFRVVPFWTGFFMIPIVFLLDRKALFQVDYIMLLTFAVFFIFSGNLARIDSVRSFLSSLTSSSTLLTGVLSSQIISNVPTAVLLSNFTMDYKGLLMAVNIAGCGTLLSSLASLITFRQFSVEQGENSWKYLFWFHAINFSFLTILTIVCMFL